MRCGERGECLIGCKGNGVRCSIESSAVVQYSTLRDSKRYEMYFYAMWVRDREVRSLKSTAVSEWMRMVLCGRLE